MGPNSMGSIKDIMDKDLGSNLMGTFANAITKT